MADQQQQQEEEQQNDPSINNDGYMDITSLVDACAATLTYANPMLCTVFFSLQDSMAAMELLDRKMDSCEIPASQIQGAGAAATVAAVDTEKNGDDNEPLLYPRPPPTELDDDFMPLPWDDLTVRDSVLIAVETLVRLESMLGGSSVVESIYTCLYAHSSVIEDMKTRLDMNASGLSPKETMQMLLQTTTTTSSSTSDSQPRGTLAQHIVYASTLAMVEITEIMRSIILHGDIYEEEDFCANTYNVAIFSNREKGSTMSELTYALKLAEELSPATNGKDSTSVDEALAAKDILKFLIELLGISATVVSKHCLDLSSV